MKKPLINCLLITLLLMVSVLTAFPAMAADDTLKWETVGKPGDEDDLVLTPSEVSQIAVSRDDVVYAIDTANGTVLRSQNGGVGWKDITSNLEDAGATLPATIVTVASDGPGAVAVVTDGGTEVFLSTDGGTEWKNTGVPAIAGEIGAVAISPEYTDDGKEVREIAIGTAQWGNATTEGQVWVRQFGKIATAWQNQTLTVDGVLAGGEVAALAYSPDYVNDAFLLAVVATATDVAPAYQNQTWLCQLERHTLGWNPLPGYPVAVLAAGDDAGVSGFGASLALPKNYSAEEASDRQLFVGFDRAPDAGDDVYWLNDTLVERLEVDGGADIGISSIAYYGSTTSGKLLAGATESAPGSFVVPVWWTDEPFEASPDWEIASVLPTGPGNASLAWGSDGSIAYCGSGQTPGVAMDESAFSASLDGDKWRQLSLMDTEINLVDVVASPNTDSLFLVTMNPYGPEGIWRSAGNPLGERWERILTIDTASDAVILKLSLNYEDDDTIYVAEAGGTQVAVSHNRGNTWKWCQQPSPEPVIDMAVGGEKTLYLAVGAGKLIKTTNQTKTWEEPVSTGLSGINTLVLADETTLLVGSTDGRVAYSTNEGDDFTVIRDEVGSGTGDVQVIANAAFAEDNTIFAASSLADDGIWRWQMGVSEAWEQIDDLITRQGVGQRLSGLVMAPEGTLYALRAEAAGAGTGGMTRTLNPLAAETEDIEFDLINDELPSGVTFDPGAVFANNPGFLRLSTDDGQNYLWTVDTANQKIYRYIDSLSRVASELLAPEPETRLHVDAAGIVSSLSLNWTELDGAIEYEIAIYEDKAAVQSIWDYTTEGHAVSVMSTPGAPVLVNGTVYYWRVRVVAPVTGPWSALQPLNPALSGGDWSPLSIPAATSPQAGADGVSLTPVFSWQPADGATGYELVLAEDSNFSDVVFSLTGETALAATSYKYETNLDYATAYFWKVRAISGGTASQWGTASFTTQAATAPAVPSSTVIPPSPVTVSKTPSPVVGVAVGVVAVLLVVLLVFIIRTRQR